MSDRRMFAIKKPDGTYLNNWRGKWIWAGVGPAKNAAVIAQGYVVGKGYKSFKELEEEGFKIVEMEYKEK